MSSLGVSEVVPLSAVLPVMAMASVCGPKAQWMFMKYICSLESELSYLVVNGIRMFEVK